MADALNEMISLYPPDVLCPLIAGISDAAEQQQRYYEYLVRTFHRHAEGPMVEYGEYFREYADYYRRRSYSLFSTFDAGLQLK